MKTLKIIGKIFLWFFAVIGFVVMVGLILLLIKNPLNIRGMIFGGGDAVVQEQGVVVPNTNKTTIPSSAITKEQKKLLEGAGINPEALPNITPEMEECFREKLGNDRVEEILGGATPGPLDTVKIGSCL